ncbi:MAG: hypothetical protein DMG49_19565 [Acidobacteria bacterium]|nr:MAG: hypothetical protein DMG49_19565 [Acidobacteriota bacterium]
MFSAIPTSSTSWEPRWRAAPWFPISFVTEHIETLHEINIEARQHALAAGVEQFEVMPALDDSPEFIAALASLVRAAAAPTPPPSPPQSANCRDIFGMPRLKELT